MPTPPVDTAPRPRATVGPHRGKPVIFVDGEPLAFTAYSPTARRELFFEQTRRFLEHNTRVFFLRLPRAQSPDFWANPFWVGDHITPAPQLPAAQVSLEEQAAFILNHRPDACLFIRFGPREPKSWLDAHPEEWFVTEEGEPLPFASLASQRYLDDSARYIETVVRWCESQPFARRVIGYWTGHKVEGSHEPVIQNWVFDHGPAMARQWRQYLRDRYGDDAALRTAWGRDDVSLDAPPLPRDPFRAPLPQVAAEPYWQAGPHGAAVRDYLDLTRRLFHAGFVAQADAHRRAADRPCVFVVDALKQVMQGWDNRSFFEPGVSWPVAYVDMLAGAGNVAVAPLLDHPGIDGLVTPHEYQARGVGGVYEAEAPADALVHRGQLFLCEMDTRSHHGRGDHYFAARDLKEFEAITWRNVAAGITRGFHSYYMDVHVDWFADPALHAVIHRQFEVIHEALQWPHADVPGIAVVLDDDAWKYTSGNGAFLNEAVMGELRQGLPRCGVPFRTYLLSDALRRGLPPHRVVYFPNLFHGDDATRAFLAGQVCRDGRVVLWGPGTAIHDGRAITAQHAAAVTGFDFELFQGNLQRRGLVTNFDHPITAEMDEGVVLGSPLAYGPALLPRDGLRLADAWTTQGRDAAALAVKPMPGWTSVFTAFAPLPARLWRGLARAAGAHVYCNSYDVLLADSAAVALHSVRSGVKTIRLPRPARVTDLVTGQTLDGPTDAISFHLDAPATALFHLA